MVIAFFSFCRSEINPFLITSIQNLKIVSLSWNLAPRLFCICKIWWLYSIFLFIDYFFASSVQKIHLAFWCYLINLPETWCYLINLPKEKKKRISPFLRIGFNCLNTTEPLLGDGLLLTTQFPGLPSTHKKLPQNCRNFT